MSDINKIILHLIRNAKPYKEITEFSDSAGVYAFFFYGSDFPLPDYTPKKGEIIYIGKTESSQKKRDAETHFATGKTGSSTVRKSFGSLLQEKLNLKPIPRGQADIEAGRKSAFKFDVISEKKLTEWMINNLGLSFYEYTDMSTIEKLETELIHEVVPVINIDKNPDNPYLIDLKKARKKASELAYQGINTGTTNKTKKESHQRIYSSANIHKYEDIWSMVIPDIKDAITSLKATEIQLKKEYFNQVGNRKSYSFNLEFRDGRIANNIGGSAVARDLARVMQNDLEIKALFKDKYVKIRMDKYFVIHITF